MREFPFCTKHDYEHACNLNPLKNLIEIHEFFFRFIQGKYTFDELPYLIFGSLSLLAAVVVYFVPETFGKNLPNTIEEIEGHTTLKNNKVELSEY